MLFKSRTELGNNLFEFIAPVALVGVVFGISLYTFQSDGVIKRFVESSVKGQTDSAGIMEFGIDTTGGIADWGDDGEDELENTGIPGIPGGGMGEPQINPGILF